MDDICHALVVRNANSPHWTIITSAPVTSQVIGVLAAVVFAGVIFLFQEAPPSEDSDNYRYSSRALVTLLSAFVSLAAASFLFSVISGEQVCRRAFAEGAAAAALFGNAVVGMFLSLCWLFAAKRIGGPHVIWAKVLLVVSSLISWTFVTLTMLDATQVVEPGRQDAIRSGLISWGAGPLLLPIMTLSSIHWIPALRKLIQSRAARAFEVSLVLSILSLIFTVSFFSVITTQPDEHSFPIAIRLAITGLLALTLCGYFANMMIIQRANATQNGAVAIQDERAEDLAKRHPTPLVRVTIEIGRRRGDH